MNFSHVDDPKALALAALALVFGLLVWAQMVIKPALRSYA